VATVSEGDIQVVMQTLMDKAKAGDVAAARLLLAYSVGQPTPQVDPDTVDHQEWDIHRRTAVPTANLTQALAATPVDLANRVMRFMLPYLDRNQGQFFADCILKGKLPEEPPAWADPSAFMPGQDEEEAPRAKP